jgi:RecA-family ATPase
MGIEIPAPVDKHDAKLTELLNRVQEEEKEIVHGVVVDDRFTLAGLDLQMISATDSSQNDVTVQSQQPEKALTKLTRAIVEYQNPTVDQMLEIHEPEWTIDNFLAKGLAGAIAGEGGAGKTTLLMHLEAHIAGALPTWFGMKINNPGVVYHFSQDDNQDDMGQARARILQEIAKTLDPQQKEPFLKNVHKNLRFMSMRAFDDVELARVDGGSVTPTTVEKQIYDAFVHLIQAKGPTERPVFIAFDTLRTFAGGSSNDDRVISVVTKIISRLATKFGANSVVLHHLSKGGVRAGGRGVDDMSGSKALSDNVRFVWLLSQVSQRTLYEDMVIDNDVQPEDAIIQFTSGRGHILTRKPEPFYIRRRGFDFERITGRNKTAAEQDTDLTEQLLDAVEELGEEASTANLVKKLNRRKSIVVEEVNQLIAHGLVVRIGALNSPQSHVKVVKTDQEMGEIDEN